MIKMRKMTAVCLALAMAAFVLTGCGGKDLTEKDVAGTYKCTVDLNEYLNKRLQEGMGSLGDDKKIDFKFKSAIETDFTLTVREDKTFEINVDFDSFADAFSKAFDKEGKGFTKEIMKTMGIGEDLISDDQLKSLMETMKTEMKSTVSSEDILKQAELAGTYTLEGRTITFKTDGYSESVKADGKKITLKKPPLEGAGKGDWKFVKEK